MFKKEVTGLKKVSIMMGSISDFDKVKPALEYFDKMDIPYSVNVFSAHRTPDEVQEFVRKAADDGYAVMLAAAGKAAHLAGAIAAQTILPVIGIPIKSSNMDGMDALLSTVQMPQGVPVATVAIDGSYNAAVLAAQILGLFNDDLRSKLIEDKRNLRKKVLQANEELQVMLGRSALQ